MPGTSRPRSRQRSKSSQNRRPESQAVPYNPATADAAPSAATTRKPLLIGAAIVGVLVVAWLGLLLLSPGLLPSFLRLGASPGNGPTPTGSSSTPVGSGTGDSHGRISFVRTSDGGAKRDLFLVNSDGTGQQQITDGIIVEGTTEWSPDGKTVLLQAGVNSISNVVVIDVAQDNSAGKPQSLTSDIGKDSAFPTWSPNGSKIAFQSKKDGDLFQVYVMDADGNNKRRLSDGKGFAGLPTWSPDGSQIAYASGEQQLAGSQRELYMVGVNGGEPRKLTSLSSSLSSPQWSPDGKSIAVLQAVAERQYNLLLVNPDNGEHRVLVEGGVLRDERFSPSGDELAYYNVTPDQGSNVYVVKVSDGVVRNLTEGPGDDYQVSWSPDGSKLTWASKPGTAEYKIVTANSDGTSLKAVSSGSGDDYQPAWGARN